MPKNTLNRRDFLKVLIASGAGLTASSLVPSKWMKPLVNTGVMPVHAQTSALVYYLEATSDEPLPDGMNFKIQHVNAFVASLPFGSSSGAHAKLAAPARGANPNGVADITVTMTIDNLIEANVASFTNPDGASRIEITSSSFPKGYADFGDVMIKFTHPGDSANFDLVFNAPHCEEYRKHYPIGNL